MEAQVVVADYAQVNGGKMYVTGGCVGMVFVQAEPPHPINVWASVVVAVPWNAHNQAHRLAVGLVHEDGERVPIVAEPSAGATLSDEDQGKFLADFNAGRAPVMQPGDDTLLPVAVPLIVGLPKLGGYRVTVEVDGTVLATSRFRVYNTASQPGLPGS